MSYSLLYSKSALKDVQKLDKVAKRRIKKKIEKYSQNPIQNAKRLVGSELGSYRWRIGNYRVVFDIQRNNILVLRIGHRREIYK